MHFPSNGTDIFNGAPLTRGDLQVFNPIRTTWQTWVKPRGVTMCYILAIGGGAGGGAGFQKTSGTNGGGGGGGQCGGVSRFYVPAFLLPDQLFIQVGDGGKGGVGPSGTGAGGAGGITYVSLGRSTTSPSLLFQTSATAPGGGTQGASGAGGTAGTVATVAVTTNPLLQLGIFSTTVTSVAATGGATAAAPVTGTLADGQIFLTPGAGGGAAAPSGNNGNNIQVTAAYEFITNGAVIANSTSPFVILAGGAGATSGQATNGSNGLNNYNPFIFTGGSGGGGCGDTAGKGGNGGRGGTGCGGGGGGCGTGATASATGANCGDGGDGGPGLVLIYSW